MKPNNNLQHNQKLIFTGLFILILLFSNSIFEDVIMTSRHGINFWNALFDGKISHFFSYNRDALYLPGYAGTMSAKYNILVYVIFAIWDFPMFLIERFGGINPLAYPLGLVYAKGISLLFLVGTCVMVRKILLLLNAEDICINICIPLFLTSSIVESTVVSMGQYDVIVLFFLLLAITSYLKENEVRCIVFFAIAISLKAFILFFFIPLLLYKYKNIFAIAIRGIFGVSLYLVTSIIPLIVDAVGVQGNNETSYASLLIKNGIQLSYEPVSVMFILFSIILMVAYIVPYNSKGTITICLGAAILIGAAIPAHPQWMIYMSTFAIISICSLFGHNIGALVAVDTIADFSMIFASHIYFGHTCMAGMIDQLWIGRICNGKKYVYRRDDIFSILSEIGYSTPVNAVYKIALAMGLAGFGMLFAIICRRNIIEQDRLETDISIQQWMVVRTLLMIIVLSLPYISFVAVNIGV